MSTPVRTLLRFTRIDREERRLFFAGMAVMALVRIALFICPVSRVARFLDGVNRTFPRPSDAPQIALHRAARRLSQAAKFCPLPMTCLAESLASKALLARHGHSGELCIGVFKTGDRLEAHCWLECENQVLIGNPVPDGKQYVRLHGAEGLIG
jgi:hypothetical protein